MIANVLRRLVTVSAAIVAGRTVMARRNPDHDEDLPVGRAGGRLFGITRRRLERGSQGSESLSDQPPKAF